MAKIKFISVVKEGSGRMEDVVFSSWKGRMFMKPYKKQVNVNSAGQQEVRKSFTALIRTWKYLGGIVKSSWEKYAEDLVMTGYNAFIGANISLHRESKPIEFTKSMGVDALMNFSASTGSASGTITAEFSPVADGLHVTFFLQKKDDARVGGPVRMVEGGAGLLSPFTLTGLDPGAEYFLYAVVTDTAYGESRAASLSRSAQCTAGA